MRARATGQAKATRASGAKQRFGAWAAGIGVAVALGAGWAAVSTSPASESALARQRGALPWQDEQAASRALPGFSFSKAERAGVALRPKELGGARLASYSAERDVWAETQVLQAPPRSTGQFYARLGRWGVEPDPEKGKKPGRVFRPLPAAKAMQGPAGVYALQGALVSVVPQGDGRLKVSYENKSALPMGIYLRAGVSLVKDARGAALLYGAFDYEKASLAAAPKSASAPRGASLWAWIAGLGALIALAGAAAWGRAWAFAE